MGSSNSSLTRVPSQESLPSRSIKEEMAHQMAVGQAVHREQMRGMITNQIATTRERFWWFLFATGLSATGVGLSSIKGKSPSPMIPPLLVLTLITAYHWDMGYGDKPNRIQSMADDVRSDTRYWFNTPVDRPVAIGKPSERIDQ
eukprot:TRINITY_DN1479_c0_g1_i2.p2 TRINITY_DN1479_c0_g1~~TRINITY_DN1479_c0_g1_i2.p2  ORF type:complete len:144 (-),score=16.87 TRINITY_DN1479_c0_g1_i2:18-449(-)